MTKEDTEELIFFLIGSAWAVLMTLWPWIFVSLFVIFVLAILAGVFNEAAGGVARFIDKLK